MNLRLIFSFVILLLPSLLFADEVSSDQQTVQDGSVLDVQSIIRDRVENGPATCLSVGIIDEKGARRFNYGTLSTTDKKQANEHTLYEIGSITKTFTALLLAHLIQTGKADLDDPIDKYLPITVNVPDWKGKKITLRHLATHTSSLPRLPTNLHANNHEEEYENYTLTDLYYFLNNYELSEPPGTRYVYSNYALGVLGHVLSDMVGQDFVQLMQKEVIGKMGMTSTTFRLSTAEESQKALPYSRAGKRTANWDMPTLQGAGALKSSLNDMLIYLAYNMGRTGSSLSPAIEMTHKKSYLIAQKDDVSHWIGLNWMIKQYRNGPEFIWHSGGTAGYSSFIGFNKKRGIGVVVLSNSSKPIIDIGSHILNKKIPLKKSAQPTAYQTHKRIGLDIGLTTDDKTLPTARVFYNYFWGPFDFFQFKPFLGISNFAIKDHLVDSSIKHSVNFKVLEAGFLFDFGNIFNILFPNTLLAHVTLQQGMKLNRVFQVDSSNLSSTDLTPHFPVVSVQQISKVGYNIGIFSICVEIDSELQHLDKEKRYSRFGTSKGTSVNKITISHYF